MAKRREEECEGMMKDGERNEELIEKERKMKVEAWKKEVKRIHDCGGGRNEKEGLESIREEKREG